MSICHLLQKSLNRIRPPAQLLIFPRLQFLSIIYFKTSVQCGVLIAKPTRSKDSLNVLCIEIRETNEVEMEVERWPSRTSRNNIPQWSLEISETFRV